MYSARVVVISVAPLFLSIIGCGQEQEEKLERAGEQIEQAVDNATDATLDAAEKAADKFESWTDQAVSNHENAGETAAKREERQPSKGADEPR